MDAASNRSQSNLIGPLVVAMAMVTPAIYVLSYGPFAWLVFRGYIGPENAARIRMFYAPIGYLLERSELLSYLWQEYLRLWQG